MTDTPAWLIRAQQARVAEADPNTENRARREGVLREMQGVPHDTSVAPMGVRREEGRDR